MSRKNSKIVAAVPIAPSPEKTPTKLGLLLAAVGQENGATLEELTGVTGWQKHSVRGAIAGSLKRKGHLISSTLIDGVRRYKLEPAS